MLLKIKELQCFKEDYEGSVSVFYAIIFICLLTFIFSLVDITRIHMLQIEALSTYKVASEAALSQYDPFLLKQYGLYTGVEGYHIEQIIGEALKVGFTHEKNTTNDYLIDYLLSSNKSETAYQSTAPKRSQYMQPTDYRYDFEYRPFIDVSFSHPRAQILEYMKAREPYLLIEPFLQYLEVMTKTSKTSQVIDEKNELVSTLDSIGLLRKKLIFLIDGISIVDDKSINRDENEIYIRRFSNIDVQDNPYFSQELKMRLNVQIINIQKSFDNVVLLLNQIEENLIYLTVSDPYESIYLEPVGEEEPIYIGEKMKDEAINALYILEKLQIELTDSMQILYDLDKVLSSHREGINIIQEIETISNTSLQALTDFQQHQINRDELLESVFCEINNEIEQVKSEISPDEINLNEVDNLGLIKEKLYANLNLFEVTEGMRSELNVFLTDYIIKRFNSLVKNQPYSSENIKSIHEEIRTFSTSRYRNYDNHLEIDKNSVVERLITLKNTFINYDDQLYLDYSNCKVSTEEKKDYASLGDTLKNLNVVEAFESKGLIQTLPQNNIDPGNLPSNLLTTQIETTFDELDSNAEMDDSIFSRLADLAENSHDTLLINEYAIGMFNNFQKNNQLNEKSMNGYDLSEHFFSYETEYILGGSLNEKTNLSLTLGYLYGVRMSCNLIHLAVDPQKRTLIINMANTIAGWWTGGVGSIVIGILIAIFWALIESIVDIFLLSAGNRVPFLKTKSTWYTSIDGDWDTFFTTGVQYSENAITKYMTQTKKDLQLNIHYLQLKATDLLEKKMLQITDASENSTSEDLKKEFQYLSTSMDELCDEATIQIETFSNDYENKMATFMDKLIYERSMYEKARHQGTNYIMQKSKNPFAQDLPAYTLAELMSDEILNKDALVFEDGWNITTSVNYKKLIYDKFALKIEQTKNDLIQDIQTKITGTMEEQVDALDQLLEESIDNGLSISKDMLHEKADEFKKSINSQIETVNPEAENKFCFIPSFTYEDYLRLFLLLPIVDETTKISRIMDLVQLNLQKNRDDYTLSLENYFVGLTLAGTVRAKTYFVPSLHNGALRQEWEVEIQPFETTFEK